MESINLKDNIFYVGVKNPELRVFDVIMETNKGTSYNSYLILDEKIALIDTVKDGYYEEFLINIKNIIGERKIDYIIVQHTELDHSGSLSRLLKDFPEAVVVGSIAAINNSRQITNLDFKSRDIKEDLNLGNTTLKFIAAPNLHWPDTIFTYADNQEVLFTCDFLGSHYCPVSDLYEDSSEEYYHEMKYYFDVIMGPFKKFVLMALDKIEGLKISLVAPSHGPIHNHDIDKYLNTYREWAEFEMPEDKRIEIFYVSAYGNTEKMAKYIEDKLTLKGYKASAHEITSMSIEEITSLIEKSSGILLGSPTINQDALKPVWDILSVVCAITNRGKAAAAFGSYGWSGEGVKMLTDRLKSLKFKVVENGLMFKFVAFEEDYKKADDFIEKFLELMK
ncbi:FprA family A-type flavoprotein [Candidatus Clostridium radicumherbarum]|uniref:FprA family A-type flavoprotein n=1 Tax=Candidatus Clostridium radicumherbarum TaxID=3381662 RepID=A0ABW8TPW6_9CLOT